MEDGGEIAGQIRGIGGFGKVVFLFGALEAIAQCFEEGFALLDELLAHAVGVVAAGECALDGEAAAGMARVGEMFDSALKKFFSDGTGSGLGEGRVDIRGGAGVVAVKDFFEEGLLVAEGGVEGGAVDAHGAGEVGEGGALVAFAPEDV